MQSNFEIAVVGTPNSLDLYRGIGCQIFEVADGKSAQQKISELSKSESPAFGIILVQTDLFETFSSEFVDQLTRRALPAVIPIPSAGGDDSDFPKNQLQKIIRRATGSDALGF